MKLLAVHTCTSACCVSLTSGERLVAETCLRFERELSSELVGVIDHVLTRGGMSLADLDGFGVGVGPGSFTSIRIGMATVAGLALSVGKPVVGFTSLEMLALNVPFAAHPVCTMLDARKKEVYVAVYRTASLPEVVVAPSVVDPASFLAAVNGPMIFVGDGVPVYHDLIRERLGSDALFLDPSCNDPRPVNGSILTGKAFESAGSSVVKNPLPLYLRPSDAEMPTKKKLSA